MASPSISLALDTPPQFTPQAFVAMLADEALTHRAVRHPYLLALAAGDVPDLRWAMADFAQQYTGYSIHFRRYLTRVIERLDDPRHRAGLLDNLAEESGNYGSNELAELAKLGVEPEWIVGVPHPDLFRRFRAAVGLQPWASDAEADEVVLWRESFLSVLEHGSAAQAVGALGLGTEHIVRSIYAPLTDAIARIPELAPRDTVFFPLHTAVDDHHNATLHNIATDLARDEAGRADLRRGMLAALDLRSKFWDWLYARALHPTHAMNITFSEPVEAFIQRIADRRSLGADHLGETWTRDPLSERDEVYRNENAKLGIDFAVDRLSFPAMQSMDPRVVRIAAGCNNELHKHAHESLFVVLEGEGELLVGDARSTVRRGDVAFVPRWIMHQTSNTSSEHPLVLLAITDFGLTSTVLGNYDRRTRLRHAGDDVQPTQKRRE